MGAGNRIQLCEYPDSWGFGIHVAKWPFACTILIGLGPLYIQLGFGKRYHE